MTIFFAPRRGRWPAAAHPRFAAALFSAWLFVASIEQVVAQPMAGDTLPGADVTSVRDWLLANNPELRALQAEADAADARILPAGALPNPMVGLRLEGIDVERDLATYSVRQTFPLWGKRALAKDIATQETIAVREDRSAVLLERMAEAEKAYVRYWHADAALRVVDRLIDLVATIETVARERYALGLAAQQDAIRAQVAQTRMRAERIERAAMREEAIAQLNAGLGRPQDAPLNPPAGEPAITVSVASRSEGVAAIARQTHPMLRARTAMATAADQSLALQQRQRMPDISVGVGYMQEDNRFDGYELMLEVEIPLQRGALREREREAAARRDAADARVEQALKQIEASFGEAWAAWASARQRQELFERTLLPQTEANFASALASYRVGEVDFATLLEALEAWQGADLSRLDARRDELIGASELRALIGSTP
jgi:outer membrane protein TolC